MNALANMGLAGGGTGGMMDMGLGGMAGQLGISGGGGTGQAMMGLSPAALMAAIMGGNGQQAMQAIKPMSPAAMFNGVLK